MGRGWRQADMAGWPLGGRGRVQRGHFWGGGQGEGRVSPWALHHLPAPSGSSQASSIPSRIHSLTRSLIPPAPGEHTREPSRGLWELTPETRALERRALQGGGPRLGGGTGHLSRRGTSCAPGTGHRQRSGGKTRALGRADPSVAGARGQEDRGGGCRAGAKPTTHPHPHATHQEMGPGPASEWGALRHSHSLTHTH